MEHRPQPTMPRPTAARTSRLTKARSRFLKAGSLAGFYNPVDDKWRELGVFDLDTLGQRKVAAMQLHDALLAWEAGVEAVAYEKPPIDVQRAMTFLAFGHWANYVVFMNANDTWTAAQQIAWAERWRWEPRTSRPCRSSSRWRTSSPLTISPRKLAPGLILQMLSALIWPLRADFQYAKQP